MATWAYHIYPDMVNYDARASCMTGRHETKALCLHEARLACESLLENQPHLNEPVIRLRGYGREDSMLLYKVKVKRTVSIRLSALEVL